MTCARHFNNRVHSMLQTLFKRGEHGVLGVVEDYTLRIEFQQPGTVYSSTVKFRIEDPPRIYPPPTA